MKGIFNALRAAADLFLPRTCIVCGRKLLLDEQHICLMCMADMPRTFFWNRSHNPMADRFNEMIGNSMDNASSEPYAFATALFFYNDGSSYREITRQVKYHGNVAAGKFFGHMLGAHLVSSKIFNDVDMVIPVPLHWTRKWKRGYNQTEIIAASVAAVLDVPLRSDILRRTRRTKTQTRLEIEQKAANVSGAFSLCLRPDAVVKPQHILLIDDVFTTGSTLMACFTTLRSAFPPSVRISVATLGFVGQ